MYHHCSFQKWDEYVVRFDNSGLSSQKAKDEFAGIVDRVLAKGIKTDYQELIQFRDVDLAIMIKKIINSNRLLRYMARIALDPIYWLAK